MPALRSLILLVILACLAPVGLAAEGPVAADLFVTFDHLGRAEVWLYPYTVEPPSGVSALSRALEATFGAPPEKVEDGASEGLWSMSAQFGAPRRALAQRRTVALAPLDAALRNAGIPGADVYVRHPRAGFSRFAEREQQPNAWGSDWTRYELTTAPGMEPLTLEYGYTSRMLPGLILPRALTLLAAIFATLWMLRLTRRAARTDADRAWFGYWRFLNLVTWAYLIIWVLSIATDDVDTAVTYFLGLPEAAQLGAMAALDIGGLFAGLLVIHVLSHDLYARFRQGEWTRRDTLRHTAWSYAAFGLPIVLALAGFGMSLEREYRWMALALLLGYATYIFGTHMAQRTGGILPRAVTVGPLRDRVFDLAHRAGVRLQQFYVLPSGRAGLMNAFAVSGQRVIVSENLLRHFPRREVDAIAAHELTHLRKGHTAGWRPALALLLIAAGTGAAFTLVEAMPDVPALPWLTPLPLVIVSAGGMFFSRRREAAADRGAAELTGDPEAMISGIFRLTRLNGLPLQWSRWDDRLLSHPSSIRRAADLGRAAGIPAERLEALARDLDAPADRYDIPESVTSDEAVFTSQARLADATRISWTLIFARILVPALFALAAVQVPTYRVPLLAAGVAATVGVWLFLLNRISGFRKAVFRKAISRRLQAQGVRVEEWGGRFVGFAPSGEPRFYEGFSEWDMGFLFLAPDRLVYVGEQTAFSLQRSEVVRVAAHAGIPGTLPAVDVRVDWCVEGRSGAFRLEAAQAPTRLRANRDARAIAARLSDWREGRLPETQRAEPPPLYPSIAVGEVTSQAPREVASFGRIVSVLLPVIGIAFGVSLLLALPVNAAGAGYVAAMAVAVTVLEYLMVRFRSRA